MRSEAMMEYIDLLNERVPGWNSSKAGRNKAAMGPVCRCLFLRKRCASGPPTRATIHSFVRVRTLTSCAAISWGR